MAMKEWHFENKFPDFSKNANEAFIAPIELPGGSSNLSSSFKAKILAAVKKLLSTVQDEAKPLVESRDCSVYTGTAGYAVLYLLCYSVFKDQHYLQDAEQIIAGCLSGVRGRRVTYLCGDAGVYVTAAIVSHSKGEHRTALRHSPRHYVKKLLSLCPAVVAGTDELPDELLYGRAGYLYALLLLHSKRICADEIEPLLGGLVGSILESGQSLSRTRGLSSECPLVYEWHGKEYYGAAHGLAGILTLLMQSAAHLPEGALQRLVRPSVHYLATKLLPSGNLPSSAGSVGVRSDRLVQWCHGAPAAVLLFAMAHKVFGSSSSSSGGGGGSSSTSSGNVSGCDYLSTARRCAEVVWQRGLLQKGCGLCHGTAGNAYSLLYLYQVCGASEYLYQCCQLASWCCDYATHGSPPADRPYSLFEGIAGTAYFLLDMMHVDAAAFPGQVIPPVTS